MICTCIQGEVLFLCCLKCMASNIASTGVGFCSLDDAHVVNKINIDLMVTLPVMCNINDNQLSGWYM